MKKVGILRIVIICLWIGAVLSMVESASAAVDYLKEVKPILAENCYRCHGGSQQKAGLRLDTVTSARKGGETGAAVKPGSSKESLVISVVNGTHDTIHGCRTRSLL